MSDQLEPYEEPNLPEPTHEQIEAAKVKVDELEAAAQKLGLYQQSCQVGVVPQPDGTVKMALIADFVPGAVAWSDRILNPDTHSIDDQFRDIERGMDEEAFEAYRRAQAAKLGLIDDEVTDE